MLLIKQNCKTNSIEIQHLFDYFNLSKIVLNLKELNTSVTVDATSNPNINDYVNPNTNTTVSIGVSRDGVFKLEYLMMASVGSVDVVLNDNIVTREGIYTEFTDVDYIFLDKLYEIDKTKCTEDTLWLKSPIKVFNGLAPVYKVYKHDDYVSYTCGIEKTIKKMILDKTPCNNCSTDNICAVLQYLTALKIDKCSSYETKKAIFSKIASLMNIKC